MITGIKKTHKTTEIFFDEASDILIINTYNTSLKNRLTAYAKKKALRLLSKPILVEVTRFAFLRKSGGQNAVTVPAETRRNLHALKTVHRTVFLTGFRILP